TGHTGSTPTGGKGACPCGGAGGGSGGVGSVPGGGGGGGYGPSGAGGAGAHGRVKISWTCPCFNATASATPTSGRKPLCVAFSACPTGGCTPYSYAWNFGSCGGTSTAKAPHHEYLHKGTYCPTVTVSDSAGHHKTPTVPQITVTPPPACCRFCASGCVKVPAGVSRAKVQVWGGGGAGACWSSCPCDVVITQGGGGGGGGYAAGYVPVTACATYHVTVGGCSHFTGNCSKEVGAHPGQNSPGAGVGGTGGSGYGTACCLVTDCGEGAGVGAGACGGGPCGGAGGTPGYYCGALAKNVPATPGSPPGGGGAGGVYSGEGRFSAASSGAHGRVVLKWCYPCAPCPPLSVTASAKPTRGKHPLAVAFKSCPTGGETPYDYLWCFACGCHAQSTAQNPSHTYPANGTYSPTLKVYCSCCYEAQPAVPQITVTCCVPPCPCTKPSQTGSINNLHIGREPIPRLSNPRRIVTCCDIGGS
ncbi:MAG TPA: PKD domain-containing protein, partial [Thermoplasmata archaeon]|nr:PKD domain-containing protein [Thermoplasmata archaeon]